MKDLYLFINVTFTGHNDSDWKFASLWQMTLNFKAKLTYIMIISHAVNIRQNHKYCKQWFIIWYKNNETWNILKNGIIFLFSHSAYFREVFIFEIITVFL